MLDLVILKKKLDWQIESNLVDENENKLEEVFKNTVMIDYQSFLHVTRGEVLYFLRLFLVSTKVAKVLDFFLIFTELFFSITDQ